MRSPFNPLLPAGLIFVLQLCLCFVAEPSRAETPGPAAGETAAIRQCATRNRDNLDDGERECLFNLVAEPCIKKASDAADNATVVSCYRTEALIWDGLLNDNYRSLLDSLDEDQAAKARAMQRAWLAYRDTTCQFYDDKIQGSMATTMSAACVTRETARRAMLLEFFSRL
jgi:uncharacterized protein YecT (DUF1311 family)